MRSANHMLCIPYLRNSESTVLYFWKGEFPRYLSFDVCKLCIQMMLDCGIYSEKHILKVELGLINIPQIPYKTIT
jgi:hypothetical protein